MTVSNDLILAVASAALSVITSASAFLISFFKSKKSKQELEIKNTQYKEELLNYKMAVLNNAFIICPNCNDKVFLKDVKIQVKNKEELYDTFSLK